ncbi:MAG: autotransporter outer membrane beta-barrel domain-containing protein, partial [Syntrophorhabdus sp.]
SYIASLGVRFKKDYVLNEGSFTPEFRIRWDHEFSNDDYAVNAVFAGSPFSIFTATGETPDRDRLAIGLGMNWHIQNNISLSLTYDGYFSGDTTQHAGMLGFRYRW